MVLSIRWGLRPSREMTMTSVAVAPGSLGTSPAMLTPKMYHLQQGLSPTSGSPTSGKVGRDFLSGNPGYRASRYPDLRRFARDLVSRTRESVSDKRGEERRRDTRLLTSLHNGIWAEVEIVEPHLRLVIRYSSGAAVDFSGIAFLRARGLITTWSNYYSRHIKCPSFHFLKRSRG